MWLKEKIKEREDYKENKKEILEEIEKNAKDILGRVGLSDKLANYPCQLSGGQKQRVAIAGVMAMRPECVIFDESTAMLDPLGRKEVLDSILKLKRKYGLTLADVLAFRDKAQSEQGLLHTVGHAGNCRTSALFFGTVYTARSMGTDCCSSLACPSQLGDILQVGHALHHLQENERLTL